MAGSSKMVASALLVAAQSLPSTSPHLQDSSEMEDIGSTMLQLSINGASSPMQFEGQVDPSVDDDTIIPPATARSPTSSTRNSRSSSLSSQSCIVQPVRLPSARLRRPTDVSAFSEVGSITDERDRSEGSVRNSGAYDTFWRSSGADTEESSFTSEDSDFENQGGDGEDFLSGNVDEDRTAAIVVIEEGKGLVIDRQRLPVVDLSIPPETTHLLLGASTTPNLVPSMLSTSLPTISSNLLALDISANYLVSLPVALSSCVVLEELNISSNPIRSLPIFISQLGALRVFLADATGISTLPHALSTLKKLDTLSVRRNKLTCLPGWLCLLPSLQRLLIADNPFQGPWKTLLEPLLTFTSMVHVDPRNNTPKGNADDSSSQINMPFQPKSAADIESALGPSPSGAQIVFSPETINGEPPSPPTPLPPSPHAPSLSRTRTAPSRALGESHGNDGLFAASPPFSARSFNQDPRRLSPGRLRRLRSADELRQSLQSSSTDYSPATNDAGSAFLDPQRNIGQGNFGSHSQEAFDINRSPSPHPRAYSPTPERPVTLHTTVPQEATMKQLDTRSLPPMASRGSSPQISRQAILSRRGEGKSSNEASDKPYRKWGFLKKMSIGKLRSSDNAESSPRLQPGLPSRSAAHRDSKASTGPPLTPSIQVQGAPSLHPGYPAQSSKSGGKSDGLLPKSPAESDPYSKRRSFLPISNFSQQPILPDAAHQTSPPIPHSNGDETEKPSSDAPPPTSDSPSPDGGARALRSIMAYLKDLYELSTPASVIAVGTPRLDASSTPGVDPQTPGLPSASDQSVVDTSSDKISVSRLDSLEDITIKEDKRKRFMVIREIVESEQSYVKGLQELVDIYIKPSSTLTNTIGSVAVSKDTIIPAADRKVVFGGLESLYSFHASSFLPALEKAAFPLLSETNTNLPSFDLDGQLSANVAHAIGSIFVSHAAFMKMYSTYINNFEASVQRIRYWMDDRSSPSTNVSFSALQNSNMSSPVITAAAPALNSSQKKRIRTFMKRCRIHPRHSQLNLDGYLLLPVQRIPRYRLLLEELVGCTSHPSMNDSLPSALQEIASLASNMNERKREAESRRRLVFWQARIRGKFPSPLVQPHRRLIMDGNLLLSRVVRKQTLAFEVLTNDGEVSTTHVECLAPEITPRPLIGILCNDLMVLCRDPSNGQDTDGFVDLWAVLRMQTLPHPASIVNRRVMRIVDNKAILYFEAQSESDALSWVQAINLHIPSKSFL